MFFDSGEKIFLQGYEAIGYELLLSEGYKENEILYKKIDMPRIMYFFNGKEKRYYPDFYIKSKNLIIEIKNTYTYNVDKVKNDIKFETTQKKYGFEHRLIIIETN